MFHAFPLFCFHHSFCFRSPSQVHYGHHVLFLVRFGFDGGNSLSVIALYSSILYFLELGLWRKVHKYLCGHWFFSLVSFYLLICCIFLFLVSMDSFHHIFLNKVHGCNLYVNATITMLAAFSIVLRVDLLNLRMKALRGSSSHCQHPKIA